MLLEGHSGFREKVGSVKEMVGTEWIKLYDVATDIALEMRKAEYQLERGHS